MVRKHFFRRLSTVLACSSFLWACGETSPFKGASAKVIPTELSSDARSDVTRIYQSGKTKSVELTLNSGFADLTQTFSLEQNPRQQEGYTQIERAISTDNYTQGHKGIASEQSFKVSEAGIFDLLLMIDNSSSMGPYQGRLSKTLPDILRHITNTNWRIAVVTSTSPCLRKTDSGKSFITRADFDKNSVIADADFQKMIKVGETGNPIERGIYMATQAMQETGCDKGNVAWLRPDSQRAVLILTDENNCGSAANEGCPGLPYEKADYFFDRVGKNVTVNAMLLTQEPPSANSSNPSDPNHDCENSGGYADLPNPTEYYKLVSATGGRFGDICRSNYSTVLDQMSDDVGKKINVQFELDFPAELASLDIQIDSKKVNAFNVNGKILTVLEPVTEKNANLVVKYKHSPVAMVKSFTPTRALDSSTVEVFVNGSALPSKDYTYNTTTGKVELRDLPGELALIKLRYRESAALPKTFNYLADYYLETLELSVAGSKTSNFTVDRAQKKITLAEAPRDGQAVYLTYELPGDRHTEYPILGVLNDEIEDYSIIDPATGATLRASLESGIIVIDPLEVSEGRKVEARYNLKHDYQGKRFVLDSSKIPFPDTLKISAGGDESVCSKNILVEQSKISFSCSDEDFKSIDVSYQYAGDYKNTFDVATDFSGIKSYRVFINGVETTKFSILGDDLVILKKNLPPGSEIKVIVHPEI